MGNAPKKYQVSAVELDYVKQITSNESSLAKLLREHTERNENNWIIELNQHQAELLRAFFTETLARVGFKQDYSLTKEGEMLEELIDRFYTS